MTAPVFLADGGELADAVRSGGGTVVLEGPEGRHAVSVKRLRPGEEVVLTDGAGTGVAGTVGNVSGKDRLEVAVTSVLAEAEPRPLITVVQALPKGDRGELAVEMLTETGVDRIVPWAASRCVTQWRGERGAKSLRKWQSAAREAGKQARRLRFPEVADLATTAQVAQVLRDAGLGVVLHEEGSESLSAAELPADGGIVLVVGPEGGVAPEELASFAEAGARPCRLGPTVLRTSTAGTAATALLMARSGRWS
ncbi:ribosomal RNA small subunit methyltransferase E [Streptomyces daqingensis]|uniref:Ribosomal RNA small subunit methyltransferase E n=1 Tax=Streptomyces daqingensis TaxID=1472640 RepID=A0ABQ2M6U8_9ACTN|nr:16S rRNA (uracil(1498)-N(3))-methyltransferase [Streptomyces daqingensis]GGO47589.1 ribosomal RNA small subunit methyltransferase E [Streptomyces daqingensis]